MAPSVSVPTQGGMFHTCKFAILGYNQKQQSLISLAVQGVTPRKPATDSQDNGKAPGAPASKRITTPHACAECKRRKM
jgi:hypothetical protein